MSAEEPDLRALLAAATAPGKWHWAGNVDTGEPFLATWIPGAGRCSVLSIGSEDRSTTGRQADEVRSYARESNLDPEEEVETWAEDQYGNPIKEPRLWFFTDFFADPARDKVIYEVAPTATSRSDKKVYRGDITGIRHPDAELIVEAVNQLPGILDRLDAVRALADEMAESQSSAVRLWGRDLRRSIDSKGLT